MVTLTVRHGMGDDVRVVFHGVSKAWSALTCGRWWLDFQSRWGLVGTVRGVEATYGRNGWHPHIHALFLTRAPVDACIADQRLLASRWRAVVRRVIGPAFEPDDDHGVVVSKCDVGAYVAKLAFEVGGSQYKAGRPGHRTPWEICKAVAERGDPRDIELWKAWQLATYGRKQLVWSRGAKEILAELGEPDSESECVDEPEAPTDVTLASFSQGEWYVLEEHTSDLLRVAETGGRDALLELARAIVARALERWDPSVLHIVADGYSPLLNRRFRFRFGRILV